MIRLVCLELHKACFARRFWLFLALFVCLNVVTMTAFDREYFSEDGMSQDEYDSYRCQVIDDIDKKNIISLLSSKDSFSGKKDQIVKALYEGCSDICVLEEDPGAVKIILDTKYTDVFIVMWIFLTVYWVFYEELKNGQYTLLRTLKHGRHALGDCKLIVVVILGLAGMTILMASRVIYAACFFDMGTLSRSIQSVYEESVLHLSVLEVLIFSFLCKCAAVISLCAAIFLCTQFFFTLWNAALFFASVFAAEFVFLHFISDTSWLVLLKEINLLEFLSTAEIFVRIKYLNLFSNAVSYSLIFAVAVSALILICPVVCHILYGYRIAVDSKHLEVKKMTVRHTVMARHEFYKLAVMGRWWAVTAILLAGTCFMFDELKLYDTEEEYYYWSYCEKLSGKFGDEQLQFLNEEQERFDSIFNDMLEGGAKSYAASVQYTVYSSFQKVCTYAESLAEIENAQIIYDKGYNYLLISENISGYVKRFAFEFMILCFYCGTVWEMEKRYNQLPLIYATKSGKKKISAIKNIYVFAAALVSSFLIFSEMFISCGQTYGFEGLSCPAACIYALNWIPQNISLIFVLVIQCLAVFLVCEICAFVLLKLFRRIFEPA